MGTVLEACGYIFAAVMGYLLLHESTGKNDRTYYDINGC